MTTRKVIKNLKSIYNSKQSLGNCQQEIPFNLKNPFPTCLSPEGVICALTYVRSRVLNTILVYCRNYKLVYARRETLAKKAKVGLSTFDRAVKYLSERGFLVVKNNGANKSCWYKVSKWFNDINVQEKLSKKLPIFYFSIKACLSAFVVGECRSINVLTSISKIQSYHTHPLTIERRKSVMQEISHKVKNLKLNLSLDEQQRLSQFSDSVLDGAVLKLRSAKNIRTPGRFLIWTCNDICKKANESNINTNQNHSTNSKFEASQKTSKQNSSPIMYNRSSVPPAGTLEWDVYVAKGSYKQALYMYELRESESAKANLTAKEAKYLKLLKRLEESQMEMRNNQPESEVISNSLPVPTEIFEPEVVTPIQKGKYEILNLIAQSFP